MKPVRLSNCGIQDIDTVQEAVCDSLINLTFQRISGFGASGAKVFGRKPSQHFVSGFLAPGFDPSGQDDETSDIRINTHGLDLAVSSGSQVTLTVAMTFSVYVRGLPSWKELNQPGLGLFPVFQPTKEVRLALREQVRERMAKRSGKEKLNGSYQDYLEYKQTAYAEACRTLGLPAPTMDLEEISLQSLDEDLEQSIHDNEEADPSQAADDRIYSKTPKALPDNLAEQQRPSEIWLRVPVSLDPWEIRPSEDLDLQSEQISARIEAGIKASVQAWLRSAEGAESAYRDVKVSPSNVASKESWEAFLAKARKQTVDVGQLLPDPFKLKFVLQTSPDRTRDEVRLLRIAIENHGSRISGPQQALIEPSCFQVGITVGLATDAHRTLPLDRVKPSYRYREFMTQPAIGVNCAVHGRSQDGVTTLSTTWAPRYILPRQVPRSESAVRRDYQTLSDPTFKVTDLLVLTDEFETWINAAASTIDPQRGIQSPTEQAGEVRNFSADLQAYRVERDDIVRGIQILNDAQVAYQANPDAAAAAPFRAWIMTNATFREAGKDRDGNVKFESWRLFQLAFVLAQLPAFASRMPEYADRFDPLRDEDTASLLFFATGGGKSEAFFGVLIYLLFLDRLRGKSFGVSALVRYPLRLLTVQQARRLFRVLVHAELIRRQEYVPGVPFQLGFWVGKSNTPNRLNDERLAKIPLNTSGPLVPDSAEEREYRSVSRALNKIPTCPFCEQATELRRVSTEGSAQRYRLALMCPNTACLWNKRTYKHGSEPLPFLLVDEDIYARAPSVILGTIDKLALIGQYHSTITDLFGMFGLARRKIEGLDRLALSRETGQHPPPLGQKMLRPLYSEGDDLFFDPLPALVIQDEAHLLEESLGTFAGLFETALEQVFRHNSEMWGDRIARRESDKEGVGPPRMPKVIAATATVSEPSRQTESLYQRACKQFPHPGPDLYASFYSNPKTPIEAGRRAFLNDTADVETYAPWSRVYVSVMTNGATHTITSVNLLAALHTVISGLLSDLWSEAESDRQLDAVNRLIAGLSNESVDAWSPKRAERLRQLAAECRFDVLATIVDLHRVVLTYVTNKKGGDVVLDALQDASRDFHSYDGIRSDELKLDLISGGVDMEGIERVMRAAERTTTEDGDFVPLADGLRNIVATSAISHGVDVDRFNSMVFAGMPSNIAEYIQASSRVGRTHVGFSLLVPTPQSRRDRYVVETHKPFHRFLERMISPPAVDRWAAHAIRRVMPSLFQAWLMGVVEPRFFANAPDKAKAPQFWRLHDIRQYLRPVKRKEALLPSFIEFVAGAVGVPGRGAGHIGSPHNTDYYRALVENEARSMYELIISESTELGGALHEFWNSTTEVRRPMLSLRDVEEAGQIRPAIAQPGNKPNDTYADQIEKAMQFLRRQRGGGSELDQEGD